MIAYYYFCECVGSINIAAKYQSTKSELGKKFSASKEINFLILRKYQLCDEIFVV